MWYVMQVQSGEEKRTMQVCEKQVEAGCYREMFVPLYKRKIRYGGVWHEEKRVLFPGYVFIDTEDIETFQKGLTAIWRLTKLLRSAGEISPVAAEEEKYFRNMMDESHTVGISRGYIIGEEICITEGALKNYTGRIYRVDRHRRTAELMVEMFGRQTKVQVGLEILKRVSDEEFRQMKEESTDEEVDSAQDKPQGENRRVRVVSGVFEGMNGEVEGEENAKHEVRVRIRLFGVESMVVFSADEIEECR